MEDKVQKFNEIKVSDFMIKEPIFITPNEKASTTELLMLRKNVGSLPVVNNSTDKRVIGIITQRDIRLARFAMNLESPNTRVRDLMTPDPIVAKVTDSLVEVLEKLVKNNIERLPVINENQNLVGYITKQSIIETIYKHLNL
ncbi:MAG: CBS domain-containing protein [Candidatus Heimdallarchaeota archaeon]